MNQAYVASEITSDQKLPRSVEQLTPEWLTAALGIKRPGVCVNSVKQDRIIWGSATKVFLTLGYDGDSQGLPSSVCVKGGFDERSRAFGLGAAYELEGYFYRDLAPDLSVEIPECYYAEAEEEQGVVILEDLSIRDAEFGTPLKPWSVDRAAQALDVLASLHGPLWGSTQGKYEWLPIGCKAARQAFEVMLSPENFPALIARDEIPELPPVLQDSARVRAGFQELWKHDDSSVHTINHGDAHFAQLYAVPGRPAAFLDWQTACLAPWAHDVSYFIASALQVEDRRSHERDLLASYLDRLEAHGGPRIQADEAWLEYRKHTLHGFAWMCVPTAMQPAEVIAEMATRYAAAIDDHDPISLLSAS